MALASAAVIFAAAAVVLMAMATQLLAATAVTTQPPAPIGQPNCSTTCGNVSVPYPLGFGPSRCYWPGLNLTCDTSHGPPRLLLGDGTFQVTEISFDQLTVRVIPTSSVVNITDDFTSDGWNGPFGLGFTEYGYELMPEENELIVLGCNVVAILVSNCTGIEIPARIGVCASVCIKAYDSQSVDVMGESSECTGTSGCCKALVTMPSTPSTPIEVQAKPLYNGSNVVEQKQFPVNVFIAEKGWIDGQNWTVGADSVKEAPLLLNWSVKWGLPAPQLGVWPCPDDVGGMLCKSEHSICGTAYPGYACYCNTGYDGNAYLAGGCQDIDECKAPNSEDFPCFGECINTIGSYYCRCPHGTYGNPSVRGGCVKYNSRGAEATRSIAAVHVSQKGQAGCSTACGDVHVPYPFGFGPAYCYWPGLNLTCDTSQHPPRLLLDSKGTLQVADISLQDATVRVIHHASVQVDNVTYSSGNPEAISFQRLDIADSYMLSTRNELVVFGYDVQATLYAGKKYRNGSSNSTITGCVSTSSSGPVEYRHCSGSDGCCHAPITEGITSKEVEFIEVNWNESTEGKSLMPLAFISEEGLTEEWWYMILNKPDLLILKSDMFWQPWNFRYFSTPLILGWAVKKGFPAPIVNLGHCPREVESRLCKSEHSNCRPANGGFTCHCHTGYDGNPYLTEGCQDECNITATALGYPCFGHCNKLPGGRFECRCPQGTHGNPFVRGGCVRLPPGLIIGLSVASAPTLLVVVLCTILVVRTVKQRKMKVLKKKYFKQNRGQLLQQLVSQKADIAEKMIIPVDELAKATNNFDKARKLGGGGHGTVYKGILSDLHVVAIKKSNITVQKEIDEFINEVAILSQINHKNVVKLFGCCLETEVPLLVYEFISNGTLYQHLHVEGPKSLSWGNRLRIAAEIATSLAYLHSSVSIPIIHRDIKSSNILLDDTLTSKVSDFGASRYIPIDKTGLTTRVQGTIGYLDPMYFYTSRLTEKSDVYSFGVMLVELLTRKKPFSYSSADGEGLAAHFVSLLAEGNLVHIIDPQVTEEGGNEAQKVAELAASCVNIRGEERPTMRQVEHTLEGLWGTKKYKKDDQAAKQVENQADGQQIEEASRRYSLEQEMMVSASYPR
ncbi:hypothetical protein BS78_06G015600 [Paspalum vaginatum]|nr:hypothetical protein BS78_06G015600 [Paspalum vaginatum]